MFPEKAEVTINLPSAALFAAEIDFGNGNIIKIPRLGELLKISKEGDWYQGNYEESIHSEPHLTQIEIFPAVEFRIPSEIKEAIALVWIKDRGEKNKWGGGGGEWVAIYKMELPIGPESKEEFYLGPFALDELCRRKILETYQISEGTIPLEEVDKTDPKKLQPSVV